MKKTVKFLIIVFILPFRLLSQEGTIYEHNFLCADSVARPYLVYVPTSYDDITKSTLLVYLHGAISRKNLKDDPLGYMKKSPLLQLADKGEFILLFSYGQAAATWFDDTGKQMVLDEIDKVVQQYKVNSGKIFLSGFSDGASGSLYFAMNYPSRFAGFIAMNGDFHVASKAGSSQCYLENLKNRPLYVVNTNEDLLYPSAKVLPIIEVIKKTNIDIVFRDLEGNHHMGYLEEETDNIINFIHNHQKKEAKQIEWETSRLQSGEIDWLKIAALDTLAAPKEWHKPKNLTLFNDKAKFGFTFDYTYQGQGLKVKGFENENATAEIMGVKKDDIILQLENDTIKSPYDPYYYLVTKKAGDSTALTILRKGEQLILKGKFKEGYNYELLDFSNSSGKVMAKVEKNRIDITTSRIKELVVDFNKLPFNPSEKITLYLNGVKKLERIIQPGEKLRIKE